VPAGHLLAATDPPALPVCQLTKIRKIPRTCEKPDGANIEAALAKLLESFL
jgi:hypothetical protein